MKSQNHRFYIILPVHNRVETTLNCLEHLSRQTLQNFTVYVIDDGSTDGTSKRATATFGDRLSLRVLPGDGNLWWTGAIHLGIEEALKEASDDDVIIMMNDDIEVGEDFLAHAEKAVLAYPNCLLTPLVVDDRDRETICKSGAIMKSWPLALSYRPFEGRKLSEAAGFPVVHDVDFLRAQATFVPVKIVRDIGNVNAKLLPHYNADSEFSYRAKRAGYRVIIHRDLVIFHSVGKTGSFNTFTAKYTLQDFWHSLSDIRSVNNIKYKIHFAWLTCPRLYLVPFLFSDAIKVVARSLGAIILGERMMRLRVWANFFFEKHST